MSATAPTPAAAMAQASSRWSPSPATAFVLALALCVAIRAILAALHWEALRYDDMLPMVQDSVWGSAAHIWEMQGRIVPAWVYSLLEATVPALALDHPALKVAAELSIAVLAVTAVFCWRIPVHAAWRLAAAAAIALHPFWIDIVQFRVNDVATVIGLGAVAAILPLAAAPRLGAGRGVGIFVLSMLALACYQPFIYLPLLWSLLAAAMAPQQLRAGLKRFGAVLAITLAALVLYTVLLQFVNTSGRTEVISSVGALLDRVQRLALLAVLRLLAPEALDGIVPRLFSFVVLVYWAVLLWRRAGDRPAMALFLLCLAGLVTSPLHLLLQDANYPPRLVTQQSLLYAAALLGLAAWLPREKWTIPGFLVAAMFAGFVAADLHSYRGQQAIWQRDVHIARYTLAQLATLPDGVQTRQPEVVGTIDRSVVYDGQSQFFSILMSQFSSNAGASSVYVLPMLAYVGGYRLDSISPDQRRDPADAALCRDLFAAPPPAPGPGVTAADVDWLSPHLRVGARDGVAVLCLSSARK